MPRQRKRENQKHFDAGFKACQLAAKKQADALRAEISKLAAELKSSAFALNAANSNYLRTRSDLLAIENLLEQYGEKIEIIKKVLDLSTATVSREQVNGVSNDNDRSPTRNNR